MHGGSSLTNERTNEHTSEHTNEHANQRAHNQTKQTRKNKKKAKSPTEIHMKPANIPHTTDRTSATRRYNKSKTFRRRAERWRGEGARSDGLHSDDGPNRSPIGPMGQTREGGQGREAIIGRATWVKSFHCCCCRRCLRCGWDQTRLVIWPLWQRRPQPQMTRSLNCRGSTSVGTEHRAPYSQPMSSTNQCRCEHAVTWTSTE